MALKGDLQNVQLADLFQTLAMNSQEGVLRLRESDREYRLYFHPRGIKLLNPTVSGRRRLGTMLLEAGLVTTGDLEQALAVQSQSGRFLGEILVERGLIDRATLDALLRRQIEEEIYSLFTFGRARFEFREGPPAGETAPVDSFFNVDAIVLEAARRLDEWGLIDERLPDLSTVFVPRHGVDSPQEDVADAYEVFSRLDGTRSVLDVSDALLSSPFETAKIVVNLLEREAIRPATTSELVDAGRNALKRGRTAKSVSLLEQAAAHIDDDSTSALPIIARLFQDAGETRRAALVELRIGEVLLNQGDRGAARRQLDRALSLAPDHPDILDTLARTCRDENDVEGEISYLEREIPILVEEGAHARTLTALDRLQEIAPSHEFLARHYVTAARGCQESQKGVRFLERVLEEAGPRTNPQAIANVYKQVLELDPTRGDIARRLRKLDQRRRQVRRIRLAAAAGSIVVVLVAAWFLQREIARRKAWKDLEPIEAHIADNHPREARALLGVVVERWGEDLLGEELAQIRALIDQQINALEIRTEAERHRLLRESLGAVQTALDGGLITEALTAFVDAVKTIDYELYHESLELKLETIRAEIEKKSTALASALRGFELPAPQFATREDLEALKRQYEPLFSFQVLDDFTRLAWSAEIATRERQAAPFSDELKEIVALARRTAREIVGPAREWLREIDDRLLKFRDLADIDQEYELARAAEEQGAITVARDKYRLILDKYGDGELTPIFRRKLEHVVSAIAESKLIDVKIAQGQVRAAHTDAFALIERFPDLHLETSVLVPMALTLSPREAHVSLSAGTRQGYILRLPSNGPIEFRAEAAGFDSLVREIDASVHWQVDVDLHRIARLTLELEAPIETSPAADGSFAFVAGRDGVLHRVDLVSGDITHSHDTHSLSGLRTPPIVEGDQVFFVTGEGRVFALRKNDLSLVWSKDLGAAPRGGLRVTPSRVLAVHESGVIVALDARNGRFVFQTSPLSGLPSGAPLVVGEAIVVPFASGRLVALDLGGRDLWKQSFGDGFVGAPASGGDATFLLATDSGRVLRITASSGETIATGEVGELPSSGPVVHGDRVLVATGDRITVLRGEDLSRLAVCGPQIAVHSPPAANDTGIFIGGQDGRLYAFDHEGGPAAWKSPMGSPVRAAPVVTPIGILVVSESGRLELLRP